MDSLKKDSEKVGRHFDRHVKDTTITITHENGSTKVDNGLGGKWYFGKIDDSVVITMLIAHTLVVRKNALESYASKFQIKLTIEEIVE